MFCVFGDGKLSYFSEKGGRLLGEFSLAGHVTKVQVEKALSGKLPFRFSVSSAAVLRIEGRKMKLGQTEALEFAAPSHDLMKEWANAMHLWRRMNWKENVKFFDNSNDMPHEEERAKLIVHLNSLNEARARKYRRSGVTSKSSRNPIMGLIYGQVSPSVKKFRDRVMYPSQAPCAPTA